MRNVEYRKRFDDENLARIEFAMDQGQIIQFVVQLECRYGKEWHPVLRYDTVHGFSHRDILHPGQSAIKEQLDVQDYNEALTFAINDLTQNWRSYRRRYEQWFTNKQQ